MKEETTKEGFRTRATRALKVAWRTGALRDLKPAAILRAGWVAARRGVGARTALSIRAAVHPHRLAIKDHRRSLTYAEADREVNRLANAIVGPLGLRRGGCAILMMENCAEYLVSWTALLRVGGKAAHASWRATPSELSYLVEHSGAALVIASRSALPTLHQLRAQRPQLSFSILCVDGDPGDDPRDRRYADVISASSDAFPTAPSAGEPQGENIVYTSGTTGKPKGAVRDFSGVGVVELARVLERLPFRGEDRHLVVCPLYHSGAQAFSMIQLGVGASLYLMPHFDPEQTLRALQEWKIDSMFLVPTMIRKLLDLPEAVRARYRPRPLRAMVSGAAAFPHALRLEAIDEFGAAALFDFYGATELGWVTLINGEEMLAKPGSVGRPNAGQRVVILDEGGRPVAPREVGKIYVRSDHPMAGYLGDEGATNEARHADLLTVDDLGYVDEDGYLFLAGRARDMVISGGVNIYPVEVEEALAHHPSIREIAVVGVPDDQWGERLIAFVVPEGELNVPELNLFAREQLAAYKVPKEWKTIDELPRNPTGKVLKRALRELASAGG